MLALRALLRGRGPSAYKAALGPIEAPNVPRSPRAISYPPADPGFPSRSVDEILAPHDELIARIKLCYGTDRTAFEREVLAQIRNYAACVHLLPATADNYFSTPGGLLRMGLEIAFFSLQATDGQIFSGRSTISIRRELEPRWRQATFIAGLCHEVHRTLSHVVVSDDRGEQWPAYLLALGTWLRSRRADRYFIRWVPDAIETRSLGVFALPQIVSIETLQHLAAGNSAIVPQLMASVSGMTGYRERNVLDELVRRSAALVIDRDLRALAQRHGKPIIGSHLERYLVDGMRRLAASNPAWKPNGEKSRVWFGRDGLFVVWPNAAGDMRRLLDSERMPAIPHEPESILQVLLAAGVVEPRSETEATWSIRPPGSSEAIDAIRLSSPAVLFGDIDDTPAPLDACLLHQPAQRPSHEREPPDAPKATPAASRLREDTQGQIPLDLDPTVQTAPAADAAVGGVATAAGLPARRFRLSAPPRLNPQVREALTQIADSLNGPASEAAAWTVPQGLFVPLAQLERRRVDPPIAVRSLDAAGMLVSPSAGDSKTAFHDHSGRRIAGVIVAPRFIDGLDPHDFVTDPPVRG